MSQFGRINFAVKFVGTDAILDWINEWVYNKCGFKMKNLCKRRKTDIVSSLEYSGFKRVFYFLNEIYKDADIYLDRKYDKYKELLGHICSRRLLKNSSLKSLELSGKPLELAKLQYEDEKRLSMNAEKLARLGNQQPSSE